MGNLVTIVNVMKLNLEKLWSLWEQMQHKSVSKKFVNLIISMLKLISRIFYQFVETSTLWFLFLLVDVFMLLDLVRNMKCNLLLNS